MNDVTDSLIDEALPRARLALLLEHFSRLDDERESWRVMYPLSEVLLLLTCATIASCDDFGNCPGPPPRRRTCLTPSSRRESTSL